MLAEVKEKRRGSWVLLGRPVQRGHRAVPARCLRALERGHSRPQPGVRTFEAPLRRALPSTHHASSWYSSMLPFFRDRAITDLLRRTLRRILGEGAGECQWNKTLSLFRARFRGTRSAIGCLRRANYVRPRQP